MLAGCVVSVFAMMLLAWAREVAGWVGGGNRVAIALAVWAIYLIDFVSLPPRGLISWLTVSHSPSTRFKRRIELLWSTFFPHRSRKRETLGQGGCLAQARLPVSTCKCDFRGSVTVAETIRRGNINLLSLFPFLGKTQLQVLSFLTSTTLMVTHGLTAYSVKERVLLRDKQVILLRMPEAMLILSTVASRRKGT